MKFRLSRLAVKLLTAAITVFSLGGCTKYEVKLVNIAVTPANLSMPAGIKQQFSAMGTFSNNAMQDLTSQVTWASQTMTTATISSGGLATAVGAGTSAITASLHGVTGQTTLTVTAPAVVSIQVTPVNPTITPGTTQQFSAMGTFTDSSMLDISSQVTWASVTSATATITPGPGAGAGLATPVAAGTSIITASLNGVTGQTTLTVAGVTLVSIKVTPTNPTVAIGQTEQFTATGTYSDNSKKDITNYVTWVSMNTATASISAGGLATPVTAGTSVIQATLGGVAGQTTMTVPAATITLVSIAGNPPTPTIAAGAVIAFTATGTYSDSSTSDLTGQVSWTSGNLTSALIDPATGLAQGLSAGGAIITATAGSVSGNAGLIVQAAAARFAYVGNTKIGSQGSISIYAVNPSNGTFSNRGYVFDPDGPSQVVPDRSGMHAYALEANPASRIIKIFDVDPVSGNLTPSKTAPVNPVSNSGQVASQGIIDPSGRFLYTANQAGNTISAYLIDINTGGLTTVTGSPYLSGTAPLAIVSDPAGRFLYCVNRGDAPPTVGGFTINPDGSLTPIAPTTIVGNGPGYPVVDRANHLYVPGSLDASISAFTIQADGSLKSVSGSPFADANGPGAVAVDPLGKFLFASHSAGGSVTVFPIGAGGALGIPITGSPFQVGLQPSSVSLDPTGAFVAVTNHASNNVSLFSLDETAGLLRPTMTVETGQVPLFTNLYTATASPTIAPAAVYAANSVANNISAYTVAPATGALTAAATSPVAGVAGNGFSATDLAGAALYTVGATAPGLLAGFSINQTSAALSPLTSSPVSLSGTVPSTALADPSERFVYVAGKGVAGSVRGFDVSTGALNPIPGSPFTDPAFANLNALAMDPQGQLVFVLRTNFIEPVRISGQNGQLVLPTASLPFTIPVTAATGTWTAGAVDASGQFLLALDSVAKSIQAFSITPPNGTSGTDGTLTAVGTAVSVGGASPSYLAIDPLDRFLFVTDSAANTITVFSFNFTTGAIAQIGVPVGVPSGAGQAAVDATGTYLYVALTGTPGSVAAYTIGSAGTLTAVPGSPIPAGNGTLGVAISNSIN